MTPGETSGQPLRELLHELRTPLAALSALTPSIEEGARATYLSVLEHLAGILHRSLGCGEPACGNDGAAVDLAVVVGDAARLVGAARSALVLRVDGVDGVAVRADRVLLTQILVNLLANAARHSPAGEPVDVSAGRDGDTVSIAVRDRGAGVPADLRDRVFEDGESFGEHGGDGIGLALSRRLAERMQGTLRLEDEPGAVFTLVLPAA